MTLSIHNQIVAKIKSVKRGNIFFPSDFLSIAPQTAVRKTLSRLKEEGFLIRLAHGIYLYPQTDKDLGALFPTADRIAEAIAKKEKIKLLPTSSFALHKLGLSTQIPLRVTYLTDGKGRKIKLAKGEIIFKQVAPKKLAAKGELSGLVIQALEALGKDKLSPRIMEKLEQALKGESRTVVQKDAKIAPAWIARILYNITAGENTVV